MYTLSVFKGVRESLKFLRNNYFPAWKDLGKKRSLEFLIAAVFKDIYLADFLKTNLTNSVVILS